nr:MULTISPECIES: hypothetical protein [Ichthyocystis]
MKTSNESNRFSKSSSEFSNACWESKASSSSFLKRTATLPVMNPINPTSLFRIS